MPGVAAAPTTSTEVDAAAATGCVDEGQARALATTGWEMTLVADGVGGFPPGGGDGGRNGFFICLARRSTQAGGRDLSKKKGLGPS